VEVHDATNPSAPVTGSWIKGARFPVTSVSSFPCRMRSEELGGMNLVSGQGVASRTAILESDFPK
jgi:hypothetical protein